jgi:apocytochrome f
MATNKFLKSLFALTIAITSFGFCVQESSAYPVFAQQKLIERMHNKLACANCHLNQKQSKLKHHKLFFQTLSFEVAIKVPYDVNKQQIGANGKKLI